MESFSTVSRTEIRRRDLFIDAFGKDSFRDDNKDDLLDVELDEQRDLLRRNDFSVLLLEEADGDGDNFGSEGVLTGYKFWTQCGPRMAS